MFEVMRGNNMCSVMISIHKFNIDFGWYGGEPFTLFTLDICEHSGDTFFTILNIGIAKLRFILFVGEM